MKRNHMSHSVQHHEAGSKGAFFIAGADGAHMATMSYSRANPSLVIIDHTDVDPSLAGQGIGRESGRPDVAIPAPGTRHPAPVERELDHGVRAIDRRCVLPLRACSRC